MLTMALIGAGFGVQVALRMRSEETSGRLEPLLATALSRRAWAGAYVAVAMAGSTLVLAANGIGAGLADAINSDDASQLPRLLAAAVVPAPAVWVVVATAVVLFGFAPRAAAAAWGVLGACALLVVLGPLLGLPRVGARPVAVRSTSRSCPPPTSAPCRCSCAERGRRGADRASASSPSGAATSRPRAPSCSPTGRASRRTRRPRCR